MSFHDFWTNENNPTLAKSDYLYGTRHIVVLVATVLICLTLALIFYKRNEKSKRTLLYVFGGILLFFEIVSRIVNLIIAESYTWESVLKILLPMHICSVMVWIFIVAIYTKNQTLINFASIGGLLATVAFLAFPAVGLNRTYMSFTCIYSTVSHAIGFVTAILMMVLGFTKFKFKDIWKTYLCFILMFGWGALLNFVIFPGADYMYMINDPLELGLSFPYQILYAGILVIYVFMFYFIEYLLDKAKLRKK